MTNSNSNTATATRPAPASTTRQASTPQASNATPTPPSGNGNGNSNTPQASNGTATRTPRNRVVYTVAEAQADATRNAYAAITGSLSGAVALGHHLARVVGKLKTARHDRDGGKADSYEAWAISLPAVRVLAATMAMKYGVCTPTEEAKADLLALMAQVKADYEALPVDGGTTPTGGLAAMLAGDSN